MPFFAQNGDSFDDVFARQRRPQGIFATSSPGSPGAAAPSSPSPTASSTPAASPYTPPPFASTTAPDKAMGPYTYSGPSMTILDPRVRSTAPDISLTSSIFGVGGVGFPGAGFLGSGGPNGGVPFSGGLFGLGNLGGADLLQLLSASHGGPQYMPGRQVQRK